MHKDLTFCLFTLYISPLPFFPASSCPCFNSFLYTLYSETLDFSPPNMISLLPFSYLLYPYFINWITDLHLQGTLSDFIPVNHSTYAFTPSFPVDNSCHCPHSPECWPVGNFSPRMEMAPSHSSLPRVRCPMHLTPYTLLILMTWIFTILPVSSPSPLYPWRFKV
jgi:hypothetical protein